MNGKPKWRRNIAKLINVFLEILQGCKITSSQKWNSSDMHRKNLCPQTIYKSNKGKTENNLKQNNCYMLITHKLKKNMWQTFFCWKITQNKCKIFHYAKCVVHTLWKAPPLFFKIAFRAIPTGLTYLIYVTKLKKFVPK